jgi:hypothetical protein
LECGGRFLHTALAEYQATEAKAARKKRSPRSIKEWQSEHIW